MSTTPSKIFAGYRALGFISNHIPLALRHHHKHKENYVITCVGKAFHTYNCSRLGIISISDRHPDDICGLAVDAHLVYTACGKLVLAFSHNRQIIHRYEGHENDVHLLLPFGGHLVSIDTESHVKVWDIESEGIHLEMNFDNDTFHITTVMHPSTYLNKIILGSKQGALQLWNIKADKMLYMFTGWGVPVTVIEQAPAIDVVAIGLADGRIIVHNLKVDQTIVKFHQDWGTVTSLSFRTDGHPVMISGSAAGHIAVWDLEKRKLKSQMRDAHFAAISGMKCLPSEPLMVTSAADNSLKVWIFDQPDGGGRLLRQRSGHSAPPTKLRHYGKNGQNIISAGQDSTLRSFSSIHDKHNKSLGRASFNKDESRKKGLKLDQYMMPPITDFVAESSRESDWDNIVACHRGLHVVTTWNYQRSTMGEHKLQHERFQHGEHKSTVAQAVAISSCGNFTVIGYSSGHVDMYNLQSGLFRGSYGDSQAHDGSVRAVAIEGLNQVTISLGADGDVKFWRFKTKELIESVHLEVPPSQICLHRESSMLAVAQDDFGVVVVDVDTRKVVRTYRGHTNKVTDLSFSPDGRWLITGSMDCTLRVWDMPTGRLIDCFLLDAAITSLSMSPTGDFLATTHVDDVAVYLWSNVTLFSHVALHPLPVDYTPQLMAMPGSGRMKDDDIADETAADAYDMSEFKSPEQISDELVTLSLLPESRWLNLLNLDIIKKRNKPKEPPKVSKAAPFFLPTIAGLQPKFVTDTENKSSDMNLSKFSGHILPMSETGQLLEDSIATGRFDLILSRLKELGPSALDVEFRSLSPEGGGSVLLMLQFMRFIRHILSTKKDFELAQAHLGLFLKLHGEIIAAEPELVQEMEDLSRSQAESWRTLQDLFNQSLCLVTYLQTATL